MAIQIEISIMMFRVGQLFGYTKYIFYVFTFQKFKYKINDMVSIQYYVLRDNHMKTLPKITDIPTTTQSLIRALIY